MSDINRAADLLEDLGFKEYHAKSLAHLLEMGESKAPDLSRASGVPKARIYGVLDDLVERGFVDVEPGRPKIYSPRNPDEIVETMKSNRRAKYECEVERIESKSDDLVDVLPDDETEAEKRSLLRLVPVGEPSERETRDLYDDAEDSIDIATKSMEYYDSVSESLRDAVDRGVDLRILFLHPSRLEESNRRVQEEITQRIEEEIPEASLRYSNSKLPLRGSIVDPTMDYTTGKAIFVVEGDEPLSLRDSAITDNPSLVAGTEKYFDLVWKHESVGGF
ncbi:TrmB family transcriptional regulator [Halorutilales archaeon Cl-col2-1]